MRDFAQKLVQCGGLVVASIAMMIATLFVFVPQTDAINVFKNPDASQADAANVVTNQGNTKTDFNTIVQRVVYILLFVIGVASVIMIIVGGIRYTIANGDQAAIKSAKNTVLYAVVGLVIALLAFAIVNFVVSRFK